MSKLKKKMFRDIKLNKSQFIAIFLMVFLGVLVYGGVRSYMDGMINTAEVFYRENNLEDLNVVGNNFSKDDLEKIKNIENKKEIIELIYELRYYRFIMYGNEFLKDIKELKISFAKTIKSLIDKATKLKVIENVSEDSKENFVILKMIFDTPIIDLQSISIEPKEENNIIYLQYYDGKVLESKKITQAKKIKIKKKTKIFI